MTTHETRKVAQTTPNPFTPDYCPTCERWVTPAHVTGSYSCLRKSGLTPEAARDKAAEL